MAMLLANNISTIAVQVLAGMTALVVTLSFSSGGENSTTVAAAKTQSQSLKYYYRCTIDTRPQKSHGDGCPAAAAVYRSWRDTGRFDDPTETRWPTPRGRSRDFRKSVGWKKNPEKPRVLGSREDPN